MRTSNSEVNTFNSCQRAHLYAYGMGFQEKGDINPALYVGTFGHKILETFFNEYISSKNFDNAYLSAQTAFVHGMEEIKDDSSLMVLCSAIWSPIDKFIKNKKEELDSRIFVPISTEEEIAVEINGVDYVGRIDLLAKYKNNTTVYDFKFLSSWPSDDILTFSGQLMGYAYALGIRHVGIIAFNKSTKAYRIYYDSLHKAQMDTFVRNLFNTVQKIAEIKSLSIKDWQLEANRIYNPYICKNCSFARICKADARENPIGMIVSQYYNIRDGYENGET